MQSSTLKEDIFYCMFAGDLETQKIKDQSIFLVGQSRVGKSTLFNYLLRGRLMGRNYNQYQTVYECQLEEVQSKPGFESVTLLPNIYPEIPVGNEKKYISLCDMAGFKDKGRSYVGVYTVSYMLKKACMKTDRAKFILVIDSANLLISQIQVLIKPFLSFIDMFNKTQLLENAQVREKLFNSVSLVVVKSEPRIKFYFSKVSQIIAGLDRLGAKKSNNEELVLYLLQSILTKGAERISIFQQAKEDQLAPTSQILQSLLDEEKNWVSYDFKKELSPEFILELPFKRQFDELDGKDKELFKEAYTKKKNYFNQVSKDLEMFIKTAKTSWYNKQISYGENFKIMNDFIKKHNVYEKQKQQIQYVGFAQSKPVKAGPQSITGMKLVKKLEAIAQVINLISQIDPSNDNTVQKLRDLKNLTKKLLGIFYEAFCQTKPEETSFILYSFLIIRGIEELAELSEIDNNLGPVFFMDVRDDIQRILSQNINSTMVSFFSKYTPADEDLDEYSAMIETFLKDRANFLESAQDLPKIYQIQIKNKLKKGDVLFREGGFTKAINEYMDANSNLQSFRINFCAQNEVESSPDPKTLDLIEARTIQIYTKIAQCLEGLKIFTKALKVYQHIDCVESQYQCYEKIIKAPADPAEKFNMMKLYAKFCEDNARQHQAIQIYQQILQKFTYMPQKKADIRMLLESCIYRDPSERNAKYREKLTNYQRIKHDANLIDEIKTELQMQSGIHEDEPIEEDNDAIFESNYA